ncbi:MAG: RraA family protein [Firmicutes bacterium]|nr:RraA family protein [Bacillota bacterium]
MEEALTRLQKLDTCAVSDALDALGVPGVALGIHALWPSGKICGRVVTMQLVPAGRQTSSQHLGTRAIMAAQPGDIIVIDHRQRVDAAGWGGLLSLAAQLRGVAGVIVDGAVRDVDESRELGFPVFARDAVPLTARGRVVEDSVNQPVTVAGIRVYPTDYVLADGSGVVFIPHERIDEVLTRAESIQEREAEMARRVREGIPVTEVMGARYEEMLKELKP